MSVATAADTIEFADIGRAVRRGWRAMAAFTVLGAVGAAGVILFAPPRFSATTSLVIKTSGEAGASILSRLGGSLGDAGGMLGGAVKSPLETEIQILQSRSLKQRVIDSLLLQTRVREPHGTPANAIVAGYALEPAFEPQTYRFVRAGDAYQVEVGGTTLRAVPGQPAKLPIGTITLRPDVKLSTFALQIRDREDAVKRLTSRLAIDKVAGEVVKIQYDGDDSLSAARVPNAMAAVYLARRSTTDRGVNQHRVEFLEAKADSAALALSTAERALRQQQERSGVIDPQVVGKIELERAAQMRAALTDLQVEDGAVRALITKVSNGTLRPRDLAAFPTFLKSAGVNQILAQLTLVETERFKLLETRTEKDPEVVALTQSAIALETQLVPLAQTYSASLSKQRADLELGLDSLRRTISGLPAVAESGLRLQRDVVRQGQIYGGLQAQLVEAKLAAISEGGDVRPLDVAVSPRKPSFPDPLMTAGVGLAGGFGAGLVAALLLGMLGRWMQDPQQVEQTTGFPALRFDAAMPLFLGSETPQTVLVVPIDSRARAEPVAQQIAHTALARSLSATVLDLSSMGGNALALPGSAQGISQAMDVNATIDRLEREHALVVVQLPSMGSPTTVAALRRSRPVVLVVPERRIDRAELMGAVQTLRRLDMPCAGIVLSGGARDRALTS
jgi:uncharacterized protein involved in exopolysaccharide biosynthesis